MYRNTDCCRVLLQADLTILSLDEQAHCLRDQPPKAQIQISSLLQPLERYMLPYLPLEAMANLRASSRTLRRLVDDAPAEAWQPAASGSLLPKCLQHVSTLCADSSDIQLMLQFQGSTISTLKRGAPSWQRKHFLHEDAEMQATSVQWAPGWPSPYIAMLLRRSDLGEEDDRAILGDIMLLDTRTWQPLEGMSPHWTTGNRPQGKWWPTSDDDESSAFIYSSMPYTRLARVAPDQWHVHSISDLNSDHILTSLSPGGAAAICFMHLDDPPAVAVCDLVNLDTSAAALQERFPVDYEALNACDPQIEPIDHLSPGWAAFDPALGQLLAIAWHAGEDPEWLTFHDAASGQLLKDIHLLSTMKNLSAGSSRPLYAWSPSGKHVLMHQNSQAANPDYLEGGVFGLDGMAHELRSHPDAGSAKVEWPTCGRYLVVIEMGAEHDEDYAGGYIWDVFKRADVFNWTTSGPFETNQVVWSDLHDSACTRVVCLVQRCKVILVLPSGTEAGMLQNMEPIPYDAPHEHLRARWSISPCGTLLVGTWQMQIAPALFCVDDAAEESQIPMPCHIWHAEIKQTAFSCCNQAVASSMEGWCMDSIAWHPCSVSRRIYAIAQEDGDVYLMDGYGHKCLRKWQRFSLGLDINQATPVLRLTWAPDGSQLAVSAKGSTTIIYSNGA